MASKKDDKKKDDKKKDDNPITSSSTQYMLTSNSQVPSNMLTTSSPMAIQTTPSVIPVAPPTIPFFSTQAREAAFCKNASTPLNIDIRDIAGYCDQKCAFTYNYTNTSCVGKNLETALNFSIDTANFYPVLYNTFNYSVENMYLCSPSIHTYNGSLADAEIIIKHVPVSGGNNLIICVPIKNTNANTKAAQLLGSLINSSARLIPSAGGSAIMNISNFNLTTFMDKKPFYSYTGSAIVGNCSNMADYIVFSIKDFYCDIISDDLATLKKLIKPVGLTTKSPISSGINLFYNKVGAGLNIKNDEIYIDCQPINQSEETIETTTVSSTGELATSLVDDKTLQMIYYVGIFIIIAIIFYVGLFLLSNSMNSTKYIAKKMTSS
jgi:carbonic anhydrase